MVVAAKGVMQNIVLCFSILHASFSFFRNIVDNKIEAFFGNFYSMIMQVLNDSKYDSHLRIYLDLDFRAETFYL